jgi:hypothetical protein
MVTQSEPLLLSPYAKYTPDLKANQQIIEAPASRNEIKSCSKRREKKGSQGHENS